jgi:hypothetical protein
MAQSHGARAMDSVSRSQTSPTLLLSETPRIQPGQCGSSRSASGRRLLPAPKLTSSTERNGQTPGASRRGPWRPPVCPILTMLCRPDAFGHWICSDGRGCGMTRYYDERSAITTSAEGSSVQEDSPHWKHQSQPVRTRTGGLQELAAYLPDQESFHVWVNVECVATDSSWERPSNRTTQTRAKIHSPSGPVG